eukprot:13143289-Ditylum_brightwellii.AAC.1
MKAHDDHFGVFGGNSFGCEYMGGVIVCDQKCWWLGMSHLLQDNAEWDNILVIVEKCHKLVSDKEAMPY